MKFDGGFLALDLWVFFFFFFFIWVLFFNKIVIFLIHFFILAEVICTPSQEIVDGYIVLLNIMGWVVGFSI